MSSPASTPHLEPRKSATPPTATPPLSCPPSPSLPSAKNDLDDIPPLTLDILISPSAKTAAVELIADSIAQQRQIAARALIQHPLCVAGLVAGLVLAYQVAAPRRDAPAGPAADPDPGYGRDLGVSMLTSAGVVMAYLMAVRYLVNGYIKLAESMSIAWLRRDDSPTGDEDIVFGTKFGDEIIGALVLRIERPGGLTASTNPSTGSAPGTRASGSSSTSAGSNSTGSGRRRRGSNRSHSGSFKGGRGVIRAWATTQRYRGQGVGTDLLREAVLATRQRCGRDAEVGFAKEHANSRMILPNMFNAPFRKREMRAAKALDEVLKEYEATRRRR